LPPALVKHQAAYSVLSVGIHDLDEQTCLKYFPVLKAVIILILEDHLQAKKKKAAEEELNRALQVANQEVAATKDQGKRAT
jgi:hypothetical protein